MNDEPKITYNNKFYEFTYQDIQFQLIPYGGRFTISINGIHYGKVNINDLQSIAKIYKSILGNDRKFPLTQQELQSLLLQVSYRISLNKFTTSQPVSSPLPTLQPHHIKLLQSPNLIDTINDIIHHATTKPFIDEDANALITFFSALSSKTHYGITLDIIASSAAGKTFLITTVLKLFPEETKYEWGNVSSQVLTYAGQPEDPADPDNTNYIIDIDGKTIAILEKEQSLSFVQNIKPLMSHDSDEVRLPRANQTPDGTRRTSYHIIRGNASFILCSTRNVIDEEEITRVFSISPSESFEKIAKVCQSQLHQASLPSNQIKTHPLLPTIREIIAALPRVHIVNIFIPYLDGLIPYNSVQRQRDTQRIINLINSITLLHQYQRPTITINGKKNVLATLEDNIIGLSLLDQILEPSLTGLSTLTLRIYELIQEMYDKNIPLAFNRIFNYIRANRISLPKKELRDNHLERLIDRGYLILYKPSRHIDKNVYQINPAADYLTRVKDITLTFLDKVKHNLPDIIKPRLNFINNTTIDYTPTMSKRLFKKLLPNIEPTPQLLSLLSFNYYTKTSNSILTKISHPDLSKYKHPLMSDTGAINEWKIEDMYRQELRRQIIGGSDIEDINIEAITYQINKWMEDSKNV